MESVSPTSGKTSSAEIPNTSASCWEIEVRVPPISTEPSVNITVPSALTLATAQEGPVLLRQKPKATPRPRFLPSNGVW